MGNGTWTGTPLVCTMPPPCSLQPCTGLSVCVEDSNQAAGYQCVCTDGATGTAGPDGTGCIVPSVLNDGSVTITVSDADDVKFQIGQDAYSVLSFDSQLQAIARPGGSIDSKVSTAIQTLSGSVDVRIAGAVGTLDTTLRYLVGEQVSNATAVAAADASAKADAAVSTAAADASSKASAALATALADTQASVSSASSSLQDALQAGDASTLQAAASNTEGVRASLASQIAGMLGCMVVLVSACLCCLLLAPHLHHPTA